MKFQLRARCRAPQADNFPSYPSETRAKPCHSRTPHTHLYFIYCPLLISCSTGECRFSPMESVAFLVFSLFSYSLPVPCPHKAGRNFLIAYPESLSLVSHKILCSDHQFKCIPLLLSICKRGFRNL